MSSQDIMMFSRMTHVRELKAEIARLKEDNSNLRDENASIKARFSLAITVMEDLRALPGPGKMVLVDGWNLILGAKKDAHSREELIAGYRGYLDANPDDSVWIVFDGPKESVVNEGRLRISYTGGSGPHRADKFICDYLRAAKYLGLSGRIEVKTNDRDIRKTACAGGACCK